MREDLGLVVVDHVDGTVFLSHFEMENTDERLPSRHPALSLRAEDVTAQCESVTSETQRLVHVFVSARNRLWNGELVSARSWLSENQSESANAGMQSI